MRGTTESRGDRLACVTSLKMAWARVDLTLQCHQVLGERGSGVDDGRFGENCLAISASRYGTAASPRDRLKCVTNCKIAWAQVVLTRQRHQVLDERGDGV